MKTRLLSVLAAVLLLPAAHLSAESFLFAFERGVGGGVGGDVNATPATANWTVLATAGAVSLGFAADNSGAPGYSAISEGTGSSAYPALTLRNPGFLYFSGNNDQPAPQVYFAFNETLTIKPDPMSGYDGTMQNAWLTDAAFPMTAITFGDLTALSVYTNPRSIADKSYHFAVKTTSGWAVSGTAFAPATTSWANAFQLDPQTGSWLGGFYDAGASTLATSLAGLSPVALSADMPVLGYGMVVFTGAGAGDQASWVRLDDYLVTAVPEPAAWPAVLAGMALVFAWARRRRRN